MTTLPTTRAAHLAPPEHSQRPWLIEGLWSAQAVGIIGGEPKCGKSFLALDLAVSVASGTACLRHFATHQRGTVLLFAAEDAPHIVRQRLEGIAAAAGVDFQTLDVEVITVPTLRLDRHDHRCELAATVARLQPRLLVLDPFVRLHGVDENVAAEVAPLLAYLRALQRSHHTAVALVHHARKGAAHERGGQALRGSSELHAWGDSNLYLRRHGQGLQLSIEHRAAPSIDRLPLARCAPMHRRSPWRSLLRRPRSRRPSLPAWTASSSFSARRPRHSRNGNCASRPACAPVTSSPPWPNSPPAVASSKPPTAIGSTR
jgi:AAA domain